MQVIRGEVQRGLGRGKVLGYPTINLKLEDHTVSGVYWGLVYLGNETPHKAAVFADQTRKIIEAHLLDFQDDLYGRNAIIELLGKIRDPDQFPNDDELKVAIEQDITKVRKHFTN